MRGGEADALQAVDFCDALQEFRKIKAMIVVRIDVLPQERDLPDAPLDPFFYGADKDGRGNRLLGPAHVRHDAIGAIVIASAHDRHKLTHAPGNMTVFDLRTAPAIFLHHSFGVFEFARADHGIDAADLCFKAFTEPLRHAADDPELHVFVRTTPFFCGEFGNTRQCPLFRPLANAAGIDDDKVSGIGIRNLNKVPQGKGAQKFVRIGNIHLAAEGLKKNGWHGR